ncbi:hypothetical protein SAMN06298216_1087 [Spirosomataceae bacterium TFI 002]|nr:hypothetical protein SAMN06298216_1087 [Spirosomataceae bacterium TFI 002]
MISGVQVEGSYFPAFDIELWNLERKIKSSTYAEQDFQVLSRYSIDGFTKYTNFYNDIKDFNITYSTISEIGISGTFSGTYSNDNGEEIVISEGEFNVPVVK